MEYDSYEDTQKHIDRVQNYMERVIDELRYRSRWHDSSKLQHPEKEAWDIATPKLAELSYGSDEYRAALREIKPAVQHHYEHNSHHPEHYENGINGMSLLDIMEMLCDWKAASERVKQRVDGDTYKNMTFLDSLEHNKERWGYSDELACILRNTARELGLA